MLLIHQINLVALVESVDSLLKPLNLQKNSTVAVAAAVVVVVVVAVVVVGWALQIVLFQLPAAKLMFLQINLV
jgi:hypothetical protein